MNKTYVNWSSGKDAALAYYLLKQNPKYQVSKLLTTVNKDLQRISMHGLQEALLDAQAESMGISLQKIYLPQQTSMQVYNTKMLEATKALRLENFSHAAFGDIFLEDLKKYREEQLKNVSLKAVFPLWKQDTSVVMRQFLKLGFKAITVCVNAKVLDKSFVGREVNETFLNDLPKTVDPCGENGEFHTFVYDGPIFKHPIPFKIGEKVLKSYSPSKNDDDDCFTNDTKSWDTEFWYCDLLPK
ncbi:diphthine--ammonia ligase [Marixanthomonas sp. SCSIO 43207]|uniref:Dph6-related ATP pyrophosphatase n=1 Tax=Marixanthomonas sp. SCSIO 43207 TaxID=2779360 RepID=UPI001CA7D2E9|nr:diphthine--ammonia ligase [Marixanthomonas sp. SCSIO 43207]UAB80512.1 diphthine--ammonia ligase [Marixanthomonas sp. SCSIO 43207]